MIYANNWFVWNEDRRMLLERRCITNKWELPYTRHRAISDAYIDKYNNFEEFVAEHFEELL